MRVLIFGFLLASASVAAVAAAQGQATIDGTWLTNDGTSKVQIAAANGTLGGRIVWLQQPDSAAGKPKVDVHNPDPALRTRPVLGLTVLSDLHYSGNNTWTGGTIYTPATGKSYPCKASLAPDGSLKLAVGGAVFGRTISWTRVRASGS